MIIGGREKSHDVIGCCRTKPECLLEVGMGDSQGTRSTQNVRASSKWPTLIVVQCSDDRGAKVMVLLGYIPLTTKQVHWLEFVTMSNCEIAGLICKSCKELMLRWRAEE